MNEILECYPHERKLGQMESNIMFLERENMYDVNFPMLSINLTSR